ncbi:TNF receptor-associated factor 3-like [Ornithodoros turicata]|uniref:TNF receptor-associated factor 3-like n=1 Tax=Ornithodoros turicata TaxID=34597 RepID=UPI00313A191F
MSPVKYMSGFSEAMDWRPIEFVDLPSLLSCSLCHVVPRETFILECSHALCDQCYQTVLQGSRLCPLDGGPVQEQEVQTLSFKPSHRTKPKMRCCNSIHGCQFVGILDEVTTHFLKDCAFQVVSCNRCSSIILRNDIVLHYIEQRCHATSSPTKGRNQVSISGNIVDTESKISVALDSAMERLCAIETQLDVHVVGIADAKEVLSATGKALSRLLDLQEQTSNVMRENIEELTKCVHTGKRLLSGAISDASAVSVSDRSSSTAEHDDNADNAQDCGGSAGALQGPRGQIGCGVSDDVDKIDEVSKVIFDTCKRLSSVDGMLGVLISRLNDGKNNVAYYHIQDFNDIEKKSDNEQVSLCSEIFVLCGYTFRLLVNTDRCDGDLCLGIYLAICRSSRDSCLKWPFTLPYTLMLVHPTDEKKNIDRYVNVLEYINSESEYFLKPVEKDNPGFGAPAVCKLQDVAKGGFVHNNSITVGVKILRACSLTCHEEDTSHV